MTTRVYVLACAAAISLDTPNIGYSARRAAEWDRLRRPSGPSRWWRRPLITCRGPDKCSACTGPSVRTKRGRYYLGTRRDDSDGSGPEDRTD